MKLKKPEEHDLSRIVEGEISVYLDCARCNERTETGDTGLFRHLEIPEDEDAAVAFLEDNYAIDDWMFDEDDEQVYCPKCAKEILITNAPQALPLQILEHRTTVKIIGDYHYTAISVGGNDKISHYVAVCRYHENNNTFERIPYASGFYYFADPEEAIDKARIYRRDNEE